MPACHLLHPPTILCIHVAHIAIHQNGSKWMELLNLPVCIASSIFPRFISEKTWQNHCLDLTWFDYLTGHPSLKINWLLVMLSARTFLVGSLGESWSRFHSPKNTELWDLLSKQKLIGPVFEVCPMEIWKRFPAFHSDIGFPQGDFFGRERCFLQVQSQVSNTRVIERT